VLLKELTGEADVDRATQDQAQICCQDHKTERRDIYVTRLEERYSSIRRCC